MRKSGGLKTGLNRDAWKVWGLKPLSKQWGNYHIGNRCDMFLPLHLVWHMLTTALGRPKHCTVSICSHNLQTAEWAPEGVRSLGRRENSLLQSRMKPRFLGRTSFFLLVRHRDMSLGCVPWCHMKKLRSKSVCEQKGSWAYILVTAASQTNRSVSVEGMCIVVNGKPTDRVRQLCALPP